MAKGAGGSTGADIELLFGVLGGGSLSGASGSKIAQDLQSIVNSLNTATKAKERGIALDLNVSETRKNMSASLKAILSGLSENKSLKLTIREIDVSPAINKAKKQLEEMLKGLTVGPGSTIKIPATSAGGSTSSSNSNAATKNTAKNLEEATRKASLFEVRLRSLTQLARDLDKALSSTYKKGFLDSGSESSNELRKQIEDYKVAVEELKKNKGALLGDTKSLADVDAATTKIRESGEAIKQTLDTIEAEGRESSEAIAAVYNAEKKGLSETAGSIKSLLGRANRTVTTDTINEFRKTDVGTPVDLAGYQYQLDTLNAKIAAFNAKKADAFDDSDQIRAETAALQAEGEQLRRNLTTLISMGESQKSMQSWDKQVSSLRNQLNTSIGWTAARRGSTSGSYADLETQLRMLDDLDGKFKESKINASAAQRQFDEIAASVKKDSSTIRSAGEATLSFGDRVSNLANKFTSWLSVSVIVMRVMQSLRAMVNVVIEVDTAMTELKKVTDETDAVYADFLEKTGARAREYGATVTDIVSATADFARLGYGIEDASTLADTAIVYKNVGDGIANINEASESIISTMQAFRIEASNAMSIVDKFNAVGNNFAISSKGVGDALMRSASSMQAAGNTIDETIALAAAANTVVQDPDKVGKLSCPAAQRCVRELVAVSVKGRRRSRPRKSLRYIMRTELGVLCDGGECYSVQNRRVCTMRKLWQNGIQNSLSV